MLRIHRFEKGGEKAGSLKDLGAASKCWAECVSPTPKELEDISKKAKIPVKELREVLDKEKRPKVYDLENYSVIIVRAPWVGHEEISTTPISIFISKNKNNIITIELKKVNSINKIKGLILEKKFDIYVDGLSLFTYRLLDKILDAYFSIFDILEEKIDAIEDEVVRRPNKSTVHSIFAVKKTLIFFHRALTANREVITAIEKEYIINIDKKNIKRFRDLYNDATQLIDMEGTYRDILTGTLDIYLSSLSNNINQVMKTLTIIASFVLIPTLISGVYGMNFSSASPYNMPELYWQYGYFFALGLMLVSIIFTYIFFRRKGWL